MKSLLIICGPTASGKSDYAHKIAFQISGEIINADAMQIYKELPIITSSPNKNHKTEIQHHLYNFIELNENFSIYKYCIKLLQTVMEVIERGKIPIIVSGSGFYLNAVIFGYYNIPQISKTKSHIAEKAFAKYTLEEIYKKLLSCDKRFIKYSMYDKYRIKKAYEFFVQTNCSIFSFYNDTNFVKPFENFEKKILYLSPTTAILHRQILKRVNFMINNGAIAEVKDILGLENTHQKNALKIIGVKEIIQYLQKEYDINDTIQNIFIRTRQYSKRQKTWFRNKLLNSKHLDTKIKIQIFNKLDNNVNYFLKKNNFLFE